MSITRYQNENLGSLILIEFIPAWQISAFTPGAGGNIDAAAITFYSGNSWQSLYCSQDTMGHRQTMSNDANGQYWNQEVIGFIPGDEDQIETGLLPIPGQRYILRITRTNNVIRIVGTPATPLDVKLDSNYQTTISGTAGTAISFTGQTLKRALIQR